MAKQQGPKNIFSFRTQKEQEQRIRSLEKLVATLFGMLDNEATVGAPATFDSMEDIDIAQIPNGTNVYIVDEDISYIKRSTGLFPIVTSE